MTSGNALVVVRFHLMKARGIASRIVVADVEQKNIVLPTCAELIGVSCYDLSSTGSQAPKAPLV